MIEENLVVSLRQEYFPIKFTGNLLADVTAVCQYHQRPKLLQHLICVADEARSLAQRFQVGKEAAYTAGLLHDLGGLVPENERVTLAKRLGLKIYPEEEQVPMLLHGKFSAVFAELFFGVKDAAILNAIVYHTTLHYQPTPLEMVVCLADKIKWDAEGTPPYLNELNAALGKSLSCGAAFFVEYLGKQDLAVVHPWLKEAQKM